MSPVVSCWQLLLSITVNVIDVILQDGKVKNIESLFSEVKLHIHEFISADGKSPCWDVLIIDVVSPKHTGSNINEGSGKQNTVTLTLI